MANLIEMSNISKAFGGSVALRDVSLELFPGKVHALMGENGAGKSTLMKILAGVHIPDTGEIFKNGHRISFSSPRDALDFGISTVFQEMSLLPNLTIAENMFLGRELTTSAGFLDYAKMETITQNVLGELGLRLSPSRMVSELSIAERQFVEIAHGIKADANIFILDEPTAALNAADVEVLNAQIRRLRDAGKAIVYISHRMDEIFKICDTVTVLKDGELVGTKSLTELTPDKLIAMMVGRELRDLFPSRRPVHDEVVMEVKHFKLEATSMPFSFALKRGELLALAGLEGQGQQKILRSLVGQHRPFGATVTINGSHLVIPNKQSAGIRHLQSKGIAFVPEDRKEEGLFLNLSISHNLAMALHAKENMLSVCRNYNSKIADLMQRLKLKARGLGAAVNSLSGGNQQKVLLGRYIACDVNILLIEEPTRGVDVGAKSEIYKLLREFTDNGGAAIILSRETIELIGLCDRILVIHNGTLVAEMPATEATEHRILEAGLRASKREVHSPAEVAA
jgi:ribose transport system ATP-binding protein